MKLNDILFESNNLLRLARQFNEQLEQDFANFLFALILGQCKVQEDWRELAEILSCKEGDRFVYDRDVHNKLRQVAATHV